MSAFETIFPTACECTAPGWCARHNCFKDRTYFEYCRRLESWFQLWERGDGPASSSSPLRKGGQDGAIGQPAVSNEHRDVCRHLGRETRRQHCPTCEGHVEIKIFACAVHRECALSPNAVGVRICATCCDYAPMNIEPRPSGSGFS